MPQHVVLKITRPLERRVTYRTDVWPLFCVNNFMVVEITSLACFVIAPFTGQFPFFTSRHINYIHINMWLHYVMITVVKVIMFVASTCFEN